MVQQIRSRTHKYVTKLYLKSEEGREFLRDLLSKKMTDKQLALLYDLNVKQVARARNQHGIFKRNCPGRRKLESHQKTEEIIDAVEVEPVVMRPSRIETHSVCIELSLEEMECLREAAENNCRSISNQAKWILRNTLTNRF